MSTLRVDNIKSRTGTTVTIPETNTLAVTGIVSVTSTGSITNAGNLTNTGSLTNSGNVNITGGITTVGGSATISGNVFIAGIATIQGNLINNGTFTQSGTFSPTNINASGIITCSGLTVNGTQTIINTTILEVADKNIGIGSTSSPTDALADGSGITIYGTTNKTLTYNNTKKAFETNIPIATNENRFITGAEKITRVDGNTATLTYAGSSSNVAICTNPSGNITLNVTGIPTSSDFDNHSITFAVIIRSTGTARTCTAVNLNGVSRTIRFVGGSLANALSGVTTTNGYTVQSFTGINTIGSASTTTNYEVFGIVSGGFF
jgi:hypothetical protein